MGKTNQSVKKYFTKMNVSFEEYSDDISKSYSLDQVDVIIKSAGIFPTTPLLIEAQLRGIEIITDLDLFALLFPERKVIAITGTNGKTTTTTIIYNILKEVPQFSVVMGGNIGIPIFDLIHINCDYYLFECSSFMLNEIKYLNPAIFVILNISEHHLDYHGNFDNYFNAKTAIVRKMTKNSTLIYNIDDQRLKNQFDNYVFERKTFSLMEENADSYFKNDFLYYHNEKIINRMELVRVEPHNIANFLSAICVAKTLNIDNMIINKVIKKFTGLKYRLELIYNNNIKIYNDSKSTGIQATLSALQSLNNDIIIPNIILIAGGKYKEENYQELLQYQSIIKKLYLYGENKHYLSDKLKNDTFSIQLFNNLNGCFEAVKEIISSGDIILFSPASASHDQYSSFEERGAEFEKLVAQYFC